MLWEGNRQIQEYTNHHIFTTVYDQDSFEPVSRLVQDKHNTNQIKVYHYHNNHLGTPQELTDENGEVVWLGYDYAWGGSYTKHYNTQYLNDIEIKDYELQPIKFQGQSLDIETGLHYNRFRYYDSDVGMFIQRDPIGLLGGVNVFAYAPNPIHWVDPLGLNKTPTKDCCKKDECGKNTKNMKLSKNGHNIHSSFTKKGQQKVDYLFSNMNDAKNRGASLLGTSKVRIYDTSGKWIGWQNNKGDSVYWKHNDWGGGQGSSTFAHINYNINGITGHFFLRDKIINRKDWCDFAKYFKLE